MYYTTQKRQLEEYRRFKRQERWEFCRHVLKTIGELAICCLFIVALMAAAALGWIKG